MHGKDFPCHVVIIASRVIKTSKYDKINKRGVT